MNIRELCEHIVKEIDPSYSIVWWDQQEKHHTTWTWDGSGVLRTSEPGDIWGAHDVAHVMVSTPYRRQFIEFGLGSSDPSNDFWPDLSDDDWTMPRKVKDPQEEENKAVELHWALVAYTDGAETSMNVADYLSMYKLPSVQKIVGMRKYPGLPEDFVTEVLRVRKEILASGER